jgi:hypothetical protein
MISVISLEEPYGDVGTVASSSATGILQPGNPRHRNTVRRAEVAEGETSPTAANELALRRALEAAGVEFIQENGGGPGVRLKKRTRPKSTK